MMTSINIQTSNAAIKALLALDPEAIITYSNEPSLSELDQKKLEEIVAKSDCGELNFYNFKEMKERSDKLLRNLGVQM